jgi:hypothetical protein
LLRGPGGEPQAISNNISGWHSTKSLLSKLTKVLLEFLK